MFDLSFFFLFPSIFSNQTSQVVINELKVCILGRFLQELVYYFVNIIESVKQHELTNVNQEVGVTTPNQTSMKGGGDIAVEALDNLNSDSDSDSDDSFSDEGASVFSSNLYSTVQNNPTCETDNQASDTGGESSSKKSDISVKKKPPMKFVIVVKKLEAIMPRNTASIEATALLIEEVVLKNKVIPVYETPFIPLYLPFKVLLSSSLSSVFTSAVFTSVFISIYLSRFFLSRFSLLPYRLFTLVSPSVFSFSCLSLF